MTLSGKNIILIGFILVLLGFILPFLVVLKVLESGFFINFFAFTASVAGLFLGLIGAALYIRENKRH
jgi:hypothetical protein